jgi:hypothetical protein
MASQPGHDGREPVTLESIWSFLHVRILPPGAVEPIEQEMMLLSNTSTRTAGEMMPG